MAEHEIFTLLVTLTLSGFTSRRFLMATEEHLSPLTVNLSEPSELKTDEPMQ